MGWLPLIEEDPRLDIRARASVSVSSQWPFPFVEQDPDRMVRNAAALRSSTVHEGERTRRPHQRADDGAWTMNLGSEEGCVI